MSEYTLSELGMDWVVSRKIRQSRYERLWLLEGSHLHDIIVDVEPFAIRLTFHITTGHTDRGMWTVEFTDVAHWEYRQHRRAQPGPGWVVSATSDAPIWSLATDTGVFFFVSASTATARPGV